MKGTVKTLVTVSVLASVVFSAGGCNSTSNGKAYFKRTRQNNVMCNRIYNPADYRYSTPKEYK